MENLYRAGCHGSNWFDIRKHQKQQKSIRKEMDKHTVVYLCNKCYMEEANELGLRAATHRILGDATLGK